jgi:hypothetical protein
LKPCALLAAIALVVVAAVGCGGSGSGSTSTMGTAAGGSPGSTQARPSIAAEEEHGGDHSIQNYGSEAEGDEKAEVTAAMLAFFRAMAAPDYAKLCAGLTSSNRAQLQQFSKLKHEGSSSCASLLPTLLTPSSSAEAKKAAAATIAKVRVGEGNAFVLFRPPGGKLSYFVMKEEDGAWRATSLAPGAPLHP